MINNHEKKVIHKRGAVEGEPTFLFVARVALLLFKTQCYYKIIVNQSEHSAVHY